LFLFQSNIIQLLLSRYSVSKITILSAMLPRDVHRHVHAAHVHMHQIHNTPERPESKWKV